MLYVLLQCTNQLLFRFSSVTNTCFSSPQFVKMCQFQWEVWLLLSVNNSYRFLHLCESHNFFFFFFSLFFFLLILVNHHFHISFISLPSVSFPINFDISPFCLFNKQRLSQFPHPLYLCPFLCLSLLVASLCHRSLSLSLSPSHSPSFSLSLDLSFPLHLSFFQPIILSLFKYVTLVLCRNYDQYLINLLMKTTREYVLRWIKTISFIFQFKRNNLELERNGPD